MTKGGLRHLLRKSDKTGHFSWIPGIGGTTAALTNENVEKVEELIHSQEENPESHESQRNIGRIIGISPSSVSRICRQSLGLTAFGKTKVQDLSDADEFEGTRDCLDSSLLQMLIKHFLLMRSFSNSTNREIHKMAVYAAKKGGFLLNGWL